jgi:lysine 2,3-aminomutase
VARPARLDGTPDRQAGPAGGAVDAEVAEGQALVRGLRGRYSGLCQPTYVLDIPGGFGKVPAGPAWIESYGAGLTATDPWGGRHPVEAEEPEV